MENFSAAIGRRWTFMDHMELPAYRDGLLGGPAGQVQACEARDAMGS
jgi:hypothetical protein